LLSEAFWSSHSDHPMFNETLKSGAIISLSSKTDMNSTFDCFDRCVETRYPPQSGHWAALFLMFKVDTKGDRVPDRTPISVGDAVYFHGMKAKDVWAELGSNERMLDCNEDHCGTGLRDNVNPKTASFVLQSDQHWGVYEEGPLVASNVQLTHCNSSSMIAMSQTDAMEHCDRTVGCYSLMSVGGGCQDDYWLPCNALVSILVADSGSVKDKCTLMRAGHEEKGGDRTPEAKEDTSLDYENLPAGYSTARDPSADELQIWQTVRANEGNRFQALGNPVKVATKTGADGNYYLFIFKNSVRITIFKATGQEELQVTSNEASLRHL